MIDMIESREITLERKIDHKRRRYVLTATGRINKKDGSYELAKQRRVFRIFPYHGALAFFAKRGLLRKTFRHHEYVEDCEITRHGMVRRVGAFFSEHGKLPTFIEALTTGDLSPKDAKTFFIVFSDTQEHFHFD